MNLTIVDFSLICLSATMILLVIKMFEPILLLLGRFTVNVLLTVPNSISFIYCMVASTKQKALHQNLKTNITLTWYLVTFYKCLTLFCTPRVVEVKSPDFEWNHAFSFKTYKTLHIHNKQDDNNE